jgi:hypothetical protein
MKYDIFPEVIHNGKMLIPINLDNIVEKKSYVWIDFNFFIKGID